MAERAHPEDPSFQYGSPYRANLFKRYAFANKFTEGKTVLDIPCGVGWGTSLLSGKHRIGIDICPNAVAYGKKHYPGIDFSVGNMTTIPLDDNSVDVIICLEGFEHVSKADGMRFIEEAARVIKKNGLLVMTVPVILPGSKHSGNPYHLHEPTLSDLKHILAQMFCTQSMEIVKGTDGPVVYVVGSPKHKADISKFLHKERNVKHPGKNILLTTSAAPIQSPFSTGEKRPPIGIGFLISVLRNAGHKVFFIDNYLQPSNFLETDYLQRYEIDYVGIYANTICFRDTLRMLHKLEQIRKTRRWNGKIIIGGPHTTVAWQTIPDFVDYIVQGEGEQAIVDIVNGNVTQRIVSYPRIENLDVLPMPAWDYFAKLPYNWNMPWFEHGPVFTMNTSRGCPFNCTFCSVQSILGRKYTYFSAERIVADIQYLIENYRVKGIYFREDNFTLNRERLKRFCTLLIEKNLHIQWACESRVSTLDREILELMAKAGLCGFYFGVESGSQRILDMLQKNITVQQIKDAFRLCNEYNIKAAASVIVGVPDEKDSDLRQTNDLLRQINPTVVWPNVFVGIPDSELYRFALNNRLYEYIDDRGLVYLQGHNSKVKHYYGVDSNAYIPFDETKKDMTIKPKISVLMSVYNGENFIEQALKSIYNQTYQDFEVIIVDDASTDKTPEILVNRKDSRTFIYRNSQNIGLTKSLNIGLKLCRGTYIARIDADDISHLQRFEKQVRYLDDNPKCLALGSWYKRIDSTGQIWSAKQTPTTYENIKKNLLIRNCVGHGTAMLRRSSLIEIGGYNEKYICAQDYDLWLRLSQVGEIRSLGEYLYYLRSWPGTISATREKQQNEYAELALQEALQRKSDNEPLNGAVLRGLADRAVRWFNNRQYPNCITTLNNTETMERNIAKRFKNYDLLRAMAFFSINMKQQCLYYLKREIENHNNTAARKFISDYFENQLKTDVQRWCLQNAKVYNLRIIDLESESDIQHNKPEESRQIPFSSGQAKPLVSVIVPAYNAEEYIAAAIESVLIQNYRDFELLIINDGSTDRTEEIAHSFKDGRIRFFRQENRGLAATHNRGIRQSRGEFITKLDADDKMMPDFVSRHLQEFDKHPDADLVYCDDFLIDQNEKPIRIIKRPEYTDRKLLIRDMFRSGFPVVPFRTCIRRSVFDKIGFFDEKLSIGEDYDMMRRLVKHGLKICHLPSALYLRRMTENSLSRNFSAQNVKFHFELIKRFTQTFSYNELFPDVEWDNIPADERQLHAKFLIVVNYLAIGQDYLNSNSASLYANIAFEHACSELHDCLAIEPDNRQIRGLLQKCELGRQRYEKNVKQAVR
jgi:radical SAM superfamily enzyme YgiQ (UPF0313 family)/glycosyltransferase involved in cell wall biosynthesis/2-polyprenyl-3-methyl-5-hydroxy-6-metoxy-1,4-benzoquinol methylase